MPKLYAGTSGFAYASWKPDFYPARMPARAFLSHYATRLNAVEINYTFRRLVSPSTLESWIAATPPSFVFALKANWRITHVKRLKEADDITGAFLRSIEPLGNAGRLGPVLFQLPPRFPCAPDLLAEYLESLPPRLRCAFEFRDPSWLNDTVYGLLERRRVCLCLAESEKLEMPEVLTSDFVYLRLRKTDYSPEEREQIAERARRLMADGRDVFLFFKHEESPAGALYAGELAGRSL
jgi:uncharacterized protein YecE (DUF72 family)